MTAQHHPRSVRRRPAARAPIGHAVVDLLAQADDHLADASTAPTPAERFRSAHLAALRSAAAVLAAQAPGTRGKRRRGHGPRSAWTQLPDMAPALVEWAAYFAGTAAQREAVEAGITGAVTPAEADDILRQSERFRFLVADHVGVPYRAPFPAPVERMVS